MTFSKLRLHIALLASCCLIPSALATDFYVNAPAGDDAWTGLCPEWDGDSCGPKATIQAALNLATSNDVIHVAPGRYVENVYYASKNVAIRAENPSVWLADPLDETQASIIDGSQPTDPDYGCAVRFYGTESPACELDGFTVTGGTGLMGSSGFTEGGGIFGGDAGTVWIWTRATISNCVITRNTARFGGGLTQCGGLIQNCDIVDNWTADPGGSNHNGGGLSACNGTIIDCNISGNESYGGGGLYSCLGDIVNCQITDNTASWSGGAMMWCDDCTVTNCNISDNVACTSGYGAGGAVFSQRATYVNCTFANNVGQSGGAIYAWQANAPTMYNCIIWGNVANDGQGHQIKLNTTTTPCTLTVAYSDLEGGAAGVYLANSYCTVAWGAGMLTTDPLFADEAAGDYSLAPDSPCVDAADNNAVPDGIDEDLTRRLRFADRPATPDTGAGDAPIVDMGPFEYQCDGDLNGDGGVTLSDLAQLLSNYGLTAVAGYADGDLNGDGNVNLSDLAALLSLYGAICP